MGRVSSAEGKSAANQFISKMPEVKTQDVVQLCMHDDGETLELARNGEAVLEVLQSQEIWLAIQGVFFDRNSDMLAIKHGAVKHAPEVMLLGTANGDPMSTSVEKP